jgi:hypothetical protein
MTPNELANRSLSWCETWQEFRATLSVAERDELLAAIAERDALRAENERLREQVLGTETVLANAHREMMTARAKWSEHAKREAGLIAELDRLRAREAEWLRTAPKCHTEIQERVCLKPLVDAVRALTVQPEAETESERDDRIVSKRVAQVLGDEPEMAAPEPPREGAVRR